MLEEAISLLQAHRAEVKHRRMFAFSAPPPDAESLLAELPLPDDYLRFVAMFGSAELYQECRQPRVEVVAPTYRCVDETGRKLLYFGRTEFVFGHFVWKEHNDGEYPEIRLWVSRGWRRYEHTFGHWLLAACKKARRDIGGRRWRALCTEAEPFSPEELRIVEARRHYEVRIDGATSAETLVLEVVNRSTMRMPYLTVGTQFVVPDAFFNPVDRVSWLDVSDLQPGMAKRVSVRHRGISDHRAATLFAVDEPIPEQRECFREFRDVAPAAFGG